ncbi:MAG TPA: MFS transporter [candidate division Zixibacteria bacterium]|nr:MFS transporter [candidate division Zixibacteria bacterium]MDD4917018.1 MFS transporter [candidate division Zixibacteria bacterium]MDM7971426.1 MFS transporter [candidate division Zixibacteria bacterium]HOD66635.1 MFS transporter [candidate division Zixibacteria bacterium]HOZ07211.1 MFS transporter [candidate division Zixibacteria bacterium]
MASTIGRKDVIGWSLYDLANTIYSMNITSLYLKRYIVEDLGRDDRWFDIPFALSMFLAALLLPAFGAMSDHSVKKKLFVFLFTLTCCLAVGGMALVPPGALIVLVALFVLANFSYEAGQPFYNALLYSVADGPAARFVSGFGVSLGYVGSILGMVLVLPFVSGELFGLTVPFVTPGGKAGAFVPTAVMFLLLSLPLFLWVRERPSPSPQASGLARAYREVWEGIRNTKKYPGVLRFLIADYFFEDAVATVVINIGLYCSVVLALDDSRITAFLIISTVSAVIGSVVIGKIAERVVLKRLLAGIVWLWIAALVVFVSTDTMTVVWILGSVVGVALGGLWTVSRPLLGELVPHDELGRFFGLFSISGRAAAVAGPLIWTSSVYLFRADRPLGRFASDLLALSPSGQAKLPYKVAVLSLVVMMAVGLIIFRKVPRTERSRHG